MKYLIVTEQEHKQKGEKATTSKILHIKESSDEVIKYLYEMQEQDLTITIYYLKFSLVIKNK